MVVADNCGGSPCGCAAGAAPADCGGVLRFPEGTRAGEGPPGAGPAACECATASAPRAAGPAAAASSAAARPGAARVDAAAGATAATGSARPDVSPVPLSRRAACAGGGTVVPSCGGATGTLACAAIAAGSGTELMASIWRRWPPARCRLPCTLRTERRAEQHNANQNSLPRVRWATAWLCRVEAATLCPQSKTKQSKATTRLRRTCGRRPKHPSSARPPQGRLAASRAPGCAACPGTRCTAARYGSGVVQHDARVRHVSTRRGTDAQSHMDHMASPPGAAPEPLHLATRQRGARRTLHPAPPWATPDNCSLEKGPLHFRAVHGTPPDSLNRVCASPRSRRPG